LTPNQACFATAPTVHNGKTGFLFLPPTTFTNPPRLISPLISRFSL
jgi:hypothetical protein